jgi:hypothetical protein
MKKVEHAPIKYQYRCRQCQRINDFQPKVGTAELLFGGRNSSSHPLDQGAPTVYVVTCRYCGTNNQLKVGG